MLTLIIWFIREFDSTSALPDVKLQITVKSCKQNYHFQGPLKQKYSFFLLSLPALFESFLGANFPPSSIIIIKDLHFTGTTEINSLAWHNMCCLPIMRQFSYQVKKWRASSLNLFLSFLCGTPQLILVIASHVWRAWLYYIKRQTQKVQGNARMCEICNITFVLGFLVSEFPLTIGFVIVFHISCAY